MPSAEATRIVQELDRLAQAFEAEVRDLATEQEIRAAAARYLGRKGRVSELMKALGHLPGADRPSVGEAVNRAKAAIEGVVSSRLTALEHAAVARDLERSVDVTLPGRGSALGTLHPLTAVRREIEEIFLGLGFEVRTGPWIETEWNNFDALNTPPDHPARDMQDTFFVEGGRVLRSHTSPVQVRTMLSGPPPVKIIAPGTVFRRDDDATHTPMFPQLEGLVVDRGVSFAELKGTLLHFVNRFFRFEESSHQQGSASGGGTRRERIRLRPSYFPFTEPSAEVDAACHMCGGSGEREGAACRLCKGSGWIEIGGAGMVHPNVFRAVGYDPASVTGFAFGMGPSRMAMLRHGVDDLRSFYENDLRFLRQFR